jgi:GAF domain-containing protein
MRQELPTAGQVVAGESETTTLFVLTDRLYRARSLQDGFDAALDAIVGSLGCERASILLFDDFGVMRFVAWRDLSENYRKTLEGHSPWKPGERDAQPIFVEDIDQTEESDRGTRVYVRSGLYRSFRKVWLQVNS